MIRLAVVGAWRAKLLPLVSRTSSQRQGKFSQFQIDELGGLGEGECPILTVKLYEQQEWIVKGSLRLFRNPDKIVRSR
jgi:hypothetical protein